MAECKLLGGCIFFNDQMANMPTTADVFKRKYCREDFESCARFKVASTLGREHVPTDLIPTQADRADELISG